MQANYGKSLPNLPTQSGGVTVAATVDNALDVGWAADDYNPNAERDGFNVYRSDDGGATYKLVQTIGDNDARAWQDTGSDLPGGKLEAGHKYWFRVRPYSELHGVTASVTKAWGMLTVTPPVAVATPTTVTGTFTQLSVLGGADATTSAYTWTQIDGPAAASLEGTPDTNAARNTVATFAAAGTYSFNVSVRDVHGTIVTSAPVTIDVVPTVTALEVIPADATLPLSGSMDLTAYVTDQFGEPMPAPAATWEIVSGPGSISGSTYTAPATPGTAVIRATSGGVSGTATLAVENAAPLLSGETYYTTNTTTVGLAVTATDDGPEPALTFAWTIIETPDGAPAPAFDSATSTAPTVTFGKAGYYELSVTVNDGALSDTMLVTVEVAQAGGVGGTGGGGDPGQASGSLSIDPGGATVLVGNTFQFTAIVTDQFGDSVADPDVTWTADHGTIDSDGLYTATGGQAEDAVHAKVGGTLTADADIAVIVPAPTGLSADAPNEREANLTWADNTAGEDGFLIEKSDAGTDAYVPYMTTPTNATGWSVVGLLPGHGYDFRVTALAGDLRSESTTATVQTPGEPDAEGVVVEWTDGAAAGDVNDHPNGSATVRNLVVGHDYHVAIGFQATHDWDGTGKPRKNDTLVVGPDTFNVQWQGRQLYSGTIVSSSNVGYYGGVNADYVDGPPLYEEDFNASSTTASLDVNTEVVDVDPHNNEGWEAYLSVTDATADPAPPTVSIAATDAEAWEVPLGDEQDNTLKFTVTRSGNEEDGDFADPLTVHLHPPAGWAVAGEDYTNPMTADTITIPSDSDHVTLSLKAKSDEIEEGSERAWLCIAADQAYRLGAYVGFGDLKDPPGSIDLDMDSDNTDGYDPPAGDAMEDSVEDRPGSEKQPGQLIQSDKFADGDDDGIVDALDGYNKDRIVGNADDTTLDNLYYANLSLPAGQDPSKFTIKLSYKESAPSDATTDPMLDPLQGNASLPAGLRIWTRDAIETRDARSVKNGGQYIPPGEYTAAQLKATGTHIVLLVEGADVSPNWGDIEIKAELGVANAGGVAYFASDTVRATVVDTSLTTHVVQPYVYDHDQKYFYPINYTSPKTMDQSALFGFTHGDPDGKATGWHGVGAFFGHAFAYLTYRVPGHDIHQFFGSTGGNDFFAEFVNYLSGNSPWHESHGMLNTVGSGPSPDASINHWLHNRNRIRESVDPGTNQAHYKELVQMHKWIVSTSVARDLNELLQPRNDQYLRGRNYSRYGLDIDATQGGCGSLLGVAMRAVGFTEPEAWLVKKWAPVSRFSNYDQWGTQEDRTHQLLSFYDTGLMAQWMIANASPTGKPDYRYDHSKYKGGRVWPKKRDIV